MNRLGEEIKDKYGNHSTIIEYNSSSDLKVQFDDGTIISGRYDCFKKGGLVYPYERTIYNKGYLGAGKYKPNTIQYRYWKSIIKRVYDPIEHDKYPNYIGCSLCEEWHNLQNFGEWFDNNYYEIEEEKMCVDKDILFKGNKIYSPDTCMIVPERINTLFTNSRRLRGKYPIGVTINKSGRFRARCNILEDGKTKTIHLGYYNTPEKAFETYKQFKEKHIKKVADYYKGLIPKKLYDSMYNYKVDIND